MLLILLFSTALHFNNYFILLFISEAVLNVFSDATTVAVQIEVMNHLKYAADRKNRRPLRASNCNEAKSASLNLAETDSET